MPLIFRGYREGHPGIDRRILFRDGGEYPMGSIVFVAIGITGRLFARGFELHPLAAQQRQHT